MIGGTADARSERNVSVRVPSFPTFSFWFAAPQGVLVGKLGTRTDARRLLLFERDLYSKQWLDVVVGCFL